MKRIIVTTTAESQAQIETLLTLGVDRIVIGNEDYGLRLPHYFDRKEMRAAVEMIHAANKEVVIAVNALMHQEMMDGLLDYLRFLEDLNVDYITVGDAGVFYLVKTHGLKLKTIYDASTMVTASRQINFWAKHAGASEAVLAREIPSAELAVIAEKVMIPAEVLVYGASVIHQSKRPLLENYYHFTHMDEDKSRERNLFLSEPNDPNSHYSIFEDRHGTHIFANHDLNLMPKLMELVDYGLTHWKLDGLYTAGDNFTSIVSLFLSARELIEKGEWTWSKAQLFSEEIRQYHPQERGLSTGFYDYDPDMVK